MQIRVGGSSGCIASGVRPANQGKDPSFLMRLQPRSRLVSRTETTPSLAPKSQKYVAGSERA